MSGLKTTAPPEERIDSSTGRLLQVGLIGAGLLFLIIAGVWGFLGDTTEYAFSYLYAYMVGFTICGGSLFWILVHHAVDANWSVVVRRILESMASLFFPWMLLLFAPLGYILWGMDGGIVYEWWDGVKEYVFKDNKALFLTPFWFTVRFALYFIFLGALGFLLRRWSIKQDESGDPALTLKMRKLSYVGIILFALSITFAGIDWLKSLNYHWFSTMWGVYIFAGSVQSAIALLIVITNTLQWKGYLKNVVTVEHNHIMGKLLLAFTIFWAYIAFSQYMLIYYANIPEETVFYMSRNTLGGDGMFGWKYFSLALATIHFFIPFPMLLSQPAKWNKRRLVFISLLILFAHAMDHYWITIPQLQLKTLHVPVLEESEGFLFSGMAILNLIGILSVMGGLFLGKLMQASIFPKRDPRLFESINLHN